MISQVPVGAAIAVIMLAGLTAAPSGASEETTSLSLTKAVEQALAQHPSVGMAKARRDEARSSVREATASWFPSIALGANLTQYEKPMLVAPLHGFDLSKLPLFDETLIQGVVSFDYTLFDGGAREAKIRRARRQIEAAQAGLDASSQALISRVVAGYLSVIAKREILAAHDHRLAALDSELKRVRQLQDVGRAADIDVLRVEAVYAAAQADRVHLAITLETAGRDLSRLIDISPETIQASSLQVIALADTSTVPRDSALARALKANASVEQARLQLASTHAARAVAQGPRWPSIRATGAYVDRGRNEGDYTAEWNAGVVLSFPVFTGGLISGGVARADASVRGAEAQLRTAELQAGEDADRALSGIAESRARARSLAAAADRFAEVARIEKLSLEAGSGTQTDYLRAEADLLSARANLVEARHAEITSTVELARITGHLSLDWIRKNMETQP